ncbi:hypothetical protein Pmani_039346 [Petrolisthes manimaculis]|uniref:Uncharacterized protein n=1 Tax=Petrolisthes manimaculis TaxID=1843537 RepID=A0AAE1NDZ5_9EUCA|nr:hypothetical protein Pmani_039346 [Petrolisthes manimaculis]
MHVRGNASVYTLARLGYRWVTPAGELYCLEHGIQPDGHLAEDAPQEENMYTTFFQRQVVASMYPEPSMWTSSLQWSTW